MVEMVVDRGMDRTEFVKGVHPSKPQHGPLSSSEGEVAILDAVVQLPLGLPAIVGSNRFEGGAIGTQPAGDDGDGPSVAFHRLLDEFQGRRVVSRLRDGGFQHLTFVINGPPQAAHLAVDLQVDLVQAPSPVGVSAHVVNPLAPDFAREHRAELVPP